MQNTSQVKIKQSFTRERIPVCENRVNTSIKSETILNLYLRKVKISQKQKEKTTTI